MLSRLKFELEELIDQMLSHIPNEMWESEKTTFCDLQMAGGQFIKKIIKKLQEAGHSDENIKSRIYGYSENDLYLSYVISDKKIIGNFDIYNEETIGNMKFDVIVGNPPYQMQVGPNKTETIWDKFVINSFKHLNDDGYLAFVHPSGWRNVDGKFKQIQNKILSKNLLYLEIHNEKDGLKTFGAETRYDWYVLHNKNVLKTNTNIKFQDGSIMQIDVKGLHFLPNDSFSKVNSLLAKNEESKVNILFSSSKYETRNTHMSKHINDTFTHPIIYTINGEHNPTFYYSSVNNKGHFGIPKLIWSNGRISSIGSYIDNNGEFGLTQFAYAIVDTPENLPYIKKAFDSIEFRNLMEACAVGQLTVNYKIISLFRKDFWKEFI